RSLAQLDAGLRHIAELVETETGRKGLADIPGAGSAGGMGFGALAFFNATLRRGIDMVLDLTGFDRTAAGADLVITGEGHLDGQSGHGKLIQGVCARAGKTPVVALAGKLSVTQEQVNALGLAAAYSINRAERPLAEMLAATGKNLEEAASTLLSRLREQGVRIPPPTVSQQTARA
ncbi:MAG TPA: glycerate kinase, partial [Rhizomicrobium sp.]|nr:glycerate kinase [Rhizomicrobium sp.]